MNDWWGISQFVIIVPVTNESSVTLAENYFNMCLWSLVCVISLLLKGDFVAMCKALDLNYNILVKRNHKELTVEYFHRFLSKAITITIEDRQSNDVFVPVGIAAGYAWNSAPIDRTSILRSTVAIGRSIRFPIDIDLSALPQLTQNNTHSTIDYLRLTNSNRCLSSSILKSLVEDRRTTYAERVKHN